MNRVVLYVAAAMLLAGAQSAPRDMLGDPTTPPSGNDNPEWIAATMTRCTSGPGHGEATPPTADTHSAEETAPSPAAEMASHSSESTVPSSEPSETREPYVTPPAHASQPHFIDDE